MIKVFILSCLFLLFGCARDLPESERFAESFLKNKFESGFKRTDAFPSVIRDSEDLRPLLGYQLTDGQVVVIEVHEMLKSRADLEWRVFDASGDLTSIGKYSVSTD